MELSANNESSTCNICGGSSYLFSQSQVLEYKAAYYQCSDCASLHVKNPHWMTEAHSRAISILDTGLVARCLSASRLMGTFLFLEGREKSSGIDWAGGTGLLTRLLRDQGFEVTSFDSFASGDLAAGFISDEANVLKPKTFISAVECFEHLANPREIFWDLVKNKEYFIFTTELLPNPIPDPALKEWWYFMPESGQHITFATLKGITKLCTFLGFEHYRNIGSLHVFSRQRIKFWTRLLLLSKFTRAPLLLLVPVYLNKKFSLTWNDKEYLTKLI